MLTRYQQVGRGTIVLQSSDLTCTLPVNDHVITLLLPARTCHVTHVHVSTRSMRFNELTR